MSSSLGLPPTQTRGLGRPPEPGVTTWLATVPKFPTTFDALLWLPLFEEPTLKEPSAGGAGHTNQACLYTPQAPAPPPLPTPAPPPSQARPRPRSTPSSCPILTVVAPGVVIAICSTGCRGACSMNRVPLLPQHRCDISPPSPLVAVQCSPPCPHHSPNLQLLDPVLKLPTATGGGAVARRRCVGGWKQRSPPLWDGAAQAGTAQHSASSAQHSTA